MSIIYRCRLCLKSSRNKIDVFKDDFPKMIEILTGLKLDPFEDFPKTSCLDCAKNVKIALKTRKQIIQSHKSLLEEFLAKCRETNVFECEINNRGSSFVEDIIKDVGTTTLDSKNNRETTVPMRKVLKRRLRSTNIEQTNVETVNAETPRSLKEENTEDPSKDATPKVEIMETLAMNCTQDDSYSSNPPSPMSDPASDDDWIPEKGEEKEPNEYAKQERKSSTLPPKSSDGVFFVKKRSTKARKPKSPETVVRIKKKPKGRVPPRRVTCDICKREVQSYWLQKHMETHQYNPVTCEFCGLVSKSATALRHHVFYYHRSAADEYMCDQCARSFRSKYRLNLHKKKEHGGTKDFECTTCGKKFFERMHLKRHVDKTHKNIRPYVCDFCGKSFKSKNHIKIHERIHSKEAPYNCHMCGESFKMKLTLRTHLKGVHNVHEEQKVFCDICKRGFASDVALKAHLNSRIHETEKCQYCSEMFTREYMINHLRDVHHVGEAL